MTDNDDALFNLLTPELQAGVIDGRYVIQAEGQDNKPVVIDAESGKFVKGTGRPLNANDPAYVGKTTAYKRSNAFNEVLEQLIPAWNEGSPDAVTSLQDLVAAAKKLAVPEKQNYTQQVTCEACGHVQKAVHVVDAKPDQKMLAFLIERLAGAANKTQTINVHSEELLQVMSDQRVLHQIEVVSLTPEQRAERIRAIQAAG